MEEKDPHAGPGTPTPRLTVKQSTFAAAYADPNIANGNGTLAAKIAGYRGGQKQLPVQASSNLRNPKVRHAIVEAMDTHGCTLERAALAAAEAMQATKRCALLDKQGNLVYTEADPDHKVRLEASKFVFHLWSKCGAIAPEQDDGERPGDHLGDDAVRFVSEDDVLSQRVEEIDVELAKLDELDGGGDRGTDQ